MKRITQLSLILLVIIFSCKKEKEDTPKPTPNPTPITKIISVGKGPDAMFLTTDKKKLYIANVGDTTISIINTSSDNVEKTITGILYPWGFSQLGTSNEVVVSAWDKQLTVIDFTKDSITRQKYFNSNLGGITTNSTGSFIYVIAISDKKVLKLNAITLDSLDSYPTGNGPDGIGISQDDNKVYVTNTSDGTISVINLTTRGTTLLNTGGKPELVHANHDNSKLYISNFNNNKIHIINTNTDSIVKELSGLDGPEEAVSNEANDKVYVVNFNLSKVYVYDIPGYTKQAKEYQTGTKPIGVIETNSRIYVTNYQDNTVSSIPK